MKLIIVIMTTFLMQVSAITYAQQITLREGSISLKKVFTEIRRQTGYTVLYRTDVINKTKPVNLDLNKVPLEDALKEILKGQNLDYVIKDKAIFVSKKETSFLENIIARFQAIDVRGKVVDENRQPLPGVSVKVKGTRQAVSTDANGYFNLPNVDESATIVLSFVGYETQEVAAKQDLQLTMKQAIANLNEVIVNKGYYTTRKELETGSVSSISAKQIEQQPVSNPLAAMAGRLPGIVITQTTGAPGGGFEVQIRGKNSLANGNDPFYIIDGVPYTSQLLPNLNNIGRNGNPLNFINPSDIESIDVLKDADATSIYGSRGANGVVLITTKKGKAGRMKVDLNVYGGIGEVAKFQKLMNTQQYLEMRREAFKNDKATPTTANAPDLLFWDTNRETNWQKELIGGKANYSDMQLSLSGGNELTQYLIGGGYHKETTVFPGSNGDQKSMLHVNVNTSSPDKKFTAQFKGDFTQDNNNIVNYDLTSNAISLPPDAPSLYNADGSLNWAPLTLGARGTFSNPLSVLNLRYKGLSTNLISNLILGYKVGKGFEIKVSAGYNVLSSDDKSLSPTTASDPGELIPSGSSQFSTGTIRSWIVEPQASYQLQKGNSRFSALAGITFQQNKNEGQSISASGFSSDALLENVGAAPSILIYNVTDIQYKYNAIYGRLNYSWKDKYLINGTIRRDGTSRFGPDKRFANFASIGGAWIFSKESLFSDRLTWFSFGKLRGSYGSTGSDQVSDYRFYDLYSPTDKSYQNIKGLYPTNLFNPDLAWELTRKLEFGLELGFSKNRIMLEADYYRNRSSNQLLNYSLSDVTGFSSIPRNLPAVTQNKGWEFVLTTININNDSFNWSTAINLTIPRNKLLSYPDLATSQYTVGQPLNIVTVNKYGGIDPATGIFRFIQPDGTYIARPTEQYVIIDLGKKFYGGLQNSLRYKNISIDMFFQFTKQLGQNNLWNGTPGSKNFNQPIALLDRWQKPGDNTTYMKYSQVSQSRPLGYAKASDLIYTDASYIRLKNLSISYSLPNEWVSKLKMTRCRIYFQGQNLWTLTNYKNGDPENQNSTALPPLRVLTVGLQTTF